MNNLIKRFCRLFALSFFLWVLPQVAMAQTATYTVGGTISGLAAGKTVILKNNTTTLLVSSASSSFTFPAQSASTSWNVSVAIQPSGQTCTVSNPSGTNINANVTNVVVTCINTYTVGGTVSGLTGASLVLRMGTISLVVNSGATTFKFASGLKTGASYNVLPAIQPPGFSCGVANGIGIIVSSNITNVAVTCVRTYTVGGTISGLTASGLTLKLNAVSKVVTAGSAAFTFASALKSGVSYTVIILTQPTGQTCSMVNGTGVIVDSNITNVSVSCITSSSSSSSAASSASSSSSVPTNYTVSGTVSGLGSGKSVVLQNNGANNQTVTNPTTGFSLPAQADGSGYNVTVLTQPVGQTCSLLNNSGTLAGANVTNVTVTCTTNTYALTVTSSGGTVTSSPAGINCGATCTASYSYGTSVTLTATPNSGATFSDWAGCDSTSGNTCTVSVTSAKSVTASFTYPVTVSKTGTGSGTVTSTPAGISCGVTCSASYSNGTSVVLTAAADITSTFSSWSGCDSVTVTTCTVSVTSAKSVTASFILKTFSVSGLNATGGAVVSITGSSLSNSPKASEYVSFNVLYGDSVGLSATKVGNTCTVTPSSISNITSNFGTLSVYCTPIAYTVSGTVSGNTGSVTLWNGGSSRVVAIGGGSFTFNSLNYGFSYNIVTSSPSGQICTVMNGTGVVTGDVTSVIVSCTNNTYTVGGTVSGLSGSLTLLNNGGDSKTISANGSFTFSTAIATGGSYSVTVGTQPNGQTCTVTSGSGTIASSNVTNVGISCVATTYKISYLISGLGTGKQLTQELVGAWGVVSAVETANGLKNWINLTTGATYNLRISVQPVGQTCTVINPSGVITNADITNVQIICTDNTYTVGGTISGLSGSVTLLNNGGDSKIVSTNGSFTFSTAIAIGGSYSVTVGTQPNGQFCTVTNGAGIIVSSNISNVSVTCVTTYTIGGTITGLDSGKSFVMQINSGTPITRTTNGTFTYWQGASSGATYTVTISTQPSGQTCTVSNATFTVASANITNVNVSCVATTYTVGGTISGLSGSVTLLNNGGDSKIVSTNGSFTFSTAIAIGGSYSVTVGTQPNGQTCTVTGSIGTVLGTNVTNVAVNCVAIIRDLKISEVSYCYYFRTSCWFEIYNPTSTAIDLGSYSIRSKIYDLSLSTWGTSTFVLPSFSLAPDSYVIVSGNTAGLSGNSQNIFISNGSIVPFWQGDYGFIEIIKNGATVDYVALTSSQYTSPMPTTSSAWSGANVTAMPLGSGITYGTSIVRPYPITPEKDTNTAADWVAVDYATPAGRNDVPAGAADADGDGIPDTAEISGGTFGGLDLYSIGARTNHKDIFIEIDYMNSTDPGVIPRPEALQKVVNAFSAKGISVHFDAGTAFNSSISLVDFNLGQGPNLVDYYQCVALDQTTCSNNPIYARSIYDWKNAFMDLRRRSVFHYLLFGYSQKANGARGSSGIAELPGNDLLVTLGGWGLTTTVGSNLNRLINYQAGTIMHEFGHNLGLMHGGDEGDNYKPNYWSVMNYLYQLNGLDPDPKSINAYQRWRKEKGDSFPSECYLVASSCGDPANFIIDYSDGSGAVLDENYLLESQNVGRGSNVGAYADWSLDDMFTNYSYRKDLNQDPYFPGYSLLHDYDDWGHIMLNFSRNQDGNAGLSLSPSVTRQFDPISDDRQPVAKEYPIMNSFSNSVQ